jgi:DNA helicase II / ATP-dependent DNA helicase PcrA
VSRLLDELSADQRSAAIHEGGPLLVLGGAGTGKTRVLLARFLWLVERGVAPEQILVVATSTAAAGELRVRLEEELERPYEELFVLPDSSFCHDSPRDLAEDRYLHILIDDFQDVSPATVALAELLAVGGAELTVLADPLQAIERSRTVEGNVEGFRSRHRRAHEVVLGHSFRCPPAVLAAVAAVAQGPSESSIPAPAPADEGPRGPDIQPAQLGAVSFWQCPNERTQAQVAAVEIERLIGREGVDPQRIAVLVRSVAGESRAVVGALEERAIAAQVLGASAFFERAEVRDVLAWMRLLADPRDAPAVVRSLARPPIELRQVDLARVIQISRRRKLDMVSALAAATESPQIPPEARERIVSFLKLHREAAAALDTVRPDLFVHRLIERIGLRRQQLFAAHADVVERLVSLARLGELAARFAQDRPGATAREFSSHLAVVSERGLPEDEEAAAAIANPRPEAVQVMSMRTARGREFDHVYVLGLDSASMPGTRRSRAGERGHESRPEHVDRMRRLLALAIARARQRLVLSYAASAPDGSARRASPLLEQARAALGAEWEVKEEELFGPAETLHSTLRLMRDETLQDVARIGGRLGELRLDTDLDISHGVVRYLELVKLAALLERPPGQDVAQALPDINARLLAATTSLQREIYESSTLDDTLLSAEHDQRARAQAMSARDEPSLERFLPRRGEGLLLSASDVQTYRSCPLRYKFARVFRIPSEPSAAQRFGIVMHQALERYHAARGETLKELFDLLERGWRRSGLGDGEQERELYEKAQSALRRYHEQLAGSDAEPVWFERAFAFKLGAHHVRGRVDRVDRLADGSYELIDYKTSRPKTELQLREDIQLSLYALAAQESWHLQASRQAYYYLLDDVKVQMASERLDSESVGEIVLDVAAAIQGQEFEPTPSHAACALCDYRLLCPAAEK